MELEDLQQEVSVATTPDLMATHANAPRHFKPWDADLIRDLIRTELRGRGVIVQ